MQTPLLYVPIPRHMKTHLFKRPSRILDKLENWVCDNINIKSRKNTFLRRRIIYLRLKLRYLDYKRISIVRSRWNRKTYTEEKEDQIASNKGNEDAHVPPPVVEGEIEAFIELVSDRESTILACTGGIIDEVSRTTGREEINHVFTTSLASWRVEKVELCSFADNGKIVKFGDDHSADQTSEWIQLVEPSTPEFRNLGLGNCDTTE